MSNSRIKNLYLLILFLFLIPCSTDGNENKIKPQKKLKTIIVDNYYPFTFINDQGKPEGFSVDLAARVASVMGLELQIESDKWDNAVKALQKGEIDFLPMMAFSPERDKLFDFSPAHTISYDAFFTRKEESKINSINDIRDKTIIVMKNDQAHEYLIFSGLAQVNKLILVDSLPDGLKLLASGKGDTALMPKLVGLLQIKKMNFENLGQSPMVIDSYIRPFSFSVKEGNNQLLERLNNGLNIVKASGQYSEIYQKWFGFAEPKGIPVKTIFKYFFIIISISAIIFLVLLLWTFSLKKQVANRTENLETEIAERKKIEKDLIESRLLLQASMESPLGIVIMSIDLNYRYLSFNNTHKNAMKQAYNKEVEIGMNVLDCITSDEDRQKARNNYDRAMAGESHSTVEIYGDINKSYFQSFYNPILNVKNEIIGITAYAMDITDRIIAAEKIHEKDIEFRKLSSNVPDLIFQFTRKPDGSYCVPIASEGIKNIFGCSPEEVIDNFEPISRVIHPDDAERVIKDIEYSAENLSFFTCEFRVRIPGRPVQWIFSRSNPEKLPDGSITWYGFNADITERKTAEDKIIQSLREKETLIRELYHRTKNTMQVIRSIILLQAIELPQNDDLQKLVKNTEDKIQAISLVHQMLYKSHDLSRISIKEYIEELSDMIMYSFSVTYDRITLNIKIDDRKFLLDTAIPFGLILNELMTNSLKYAFPDNRNGVINISLNCDDSEKNIFYYSDNGAGVGDGFDFRNQKTLGFKLVYNIAELQMLGKVIFENNNGISCMIEFPAKLYKERV